MDWLATADKQVCVRKQTNLHAHEWLYSDFTSSVLMIYYVTCKSRSKLKYERVRRFMIITNNYIYMRL